MAGLNLRDNLSFSKKSDSRDGFVETVYWQNIITISLSLLLSGMYYNEVLVWLTEIIKIENRYSYNTLAAHQYYTTAARYSYYGTPHSTTVELRYSHVTLYWLSWECSYYIQYDDARKCSFLRPLSLSLISQARG